MVHPALLLAVGLCLLMAPLLRSAQDPRGWLGLTPGGQWFWPKNEAGLGEAGLRAPVERRVPPASKGLLLSGTGSAQWEQQRLKKWEEAHVFSGEVPPGHGWAHVFSSGPERLPEGVQWWKACCLVHDHHPYMAVSLPLQETQPPSSLPSFTIYVRGLIVST